MNHRAKGRLAGCKTIQTTLIVLVVALAVLSIVGATRQLMIQWRAYSDARQVVDNNAIIDDLLQAAQNLAFERGRTNVVLRGQNAITPENRAFLDDRRQTATRHMERALERLAGMETPHLARMLASYAELQALRHDVDLAATFAIDLRDPTMPDRWVRTASGLLRSMADMVTSIAAQRGSTSFEFRLFSWIKAAAFQLRDDAGMESSRLASAVTSGGPIGPSQLSDLMILRGREQSHWSHLQRDITLTGSQPLQMAMQTVQTEFFDKFRPLEDRVLAMGLSGGRYDLNTKEFTSASVPALDSIAALMAATTAETQIYAESNMRDAQWSMATHAIAVLLATLLAVTAMGHVVIRLILPLRQIQRDLTHLAAGQTDISIILPSRHDEMTEMSRALVAFRDSLQARQRMELALRERDALNQALMNATRDAAFLLDRAGIVRAANQALADRLGIDSRDIVGQHFLTAFPNANLDARDKALQQCLQTGMPCQLQDERSGLVLDNQLYPVLSADGQVQMVAVFSRDITEQRQAQRQLEQTLDELARSNAELESFAYAASHDLRQPLRMINSYLTLLMRRLNAVMDDESRKYLDFATDGAKRMDRMINDLLAYSRIGRQDQSWEVVSLNALFPVILRTMDPVIREQQVSVSLPDSLPVIWGVASELERLFQNLFSNALKFRVPGRPQKLSLSCHQDGDEWIISVQDNGIGIASGDIGRLFSVFQRLVSQDKYEGTGIGLASCRKICQHHHGRIWVESAHGEGSTFHVALPVMNSNSHPA